MSRHDSNHDAHHYGRHEGRGYHGGYQHRPDNRAVHGDEAYNGNPHRLYRNTQHRILTGVCAGVADYFGFNRRAVRVATVIAAIPFFAFTVVAYIVLSFVLPERPRQLCPDPEKEEFWRNATMEPKNTFGTVRHRFRELDVRLQRLEAYVTSKRFEIDRALKD